MVRTIPRSIIATVAIIISTIVVPATITACTSAIIGCKASASGKAMLWKHRDTSAPCNFVDTIHGTGGNLSYIALFNGADTLRHEAWIGYNETGFAIMNTASHNMPRIVGAPEDREGLVMSMALRQCRSIADFKNMLDTIARPMGVRANFGVIDAYGNGAFFETCDTAFTAVYLSDTTCDVIVRTNHSPSQPLAGGTGFDRKRTAEALLAPFAKSHTITPELLTETLSRSFYHEPSRHDFLTDSLIMLGEHLIPRPTTEASVVIESSDNISDYTMWTMLGWTPVAHTIAASLHELPSELALDIEQLQAPAYGKAQWYKNIAVKKIGDNFFANTRLLRMFMEQAHQRSVNNYRKQRIQP